MTLLIRAALSGIVEYSYSDSAADVICRTGHRLSGASCGFSASVPVLVVIVACESSWSFAFATAIHHHLEDTVNSIYLQWS